MNPRKPYDDLPRLPPRKPLETVAVLKKCIAARAALGELKQAGRRLPDQTVLINTIPLLEAQASSEIENIVTTADSLFRHSGEDDAKTDPATKEALRYRTALRRGHDLIRGGHPQSKKTAIEICQIIKGAPMSVRRIPGTFLQGKNGRPIYTPPQGEKLLLDLLDNWERFIHADKPALDPLVRMAVAHYQFEAIHPFADGNGRTGRILNILHLMERGLLDIPILYLSRHILNYREKYYKLLDGVTRRAEWEPWILYMLDAIEKTSRWMIARIDAVCNLMSHTAEHIRRHSWPPSTSESIANCIFMQPYCRIRNFMSAVKCSRITAAKYLRELRAIGVLEEIKAGREVLFIHRKYRDLVIGDSHKFSRYPAAKNALQSRIRNSKE